jgi:hypothetical protein
VLADGRAERLVGRHPRFVERSEVLLRAIAIAAAGHRPDAAEDAWLPRGAREG